MKLNLLNDRIIGIQREYKSLLVNVLPSLKSSNNMDVIDEINLFWARNLDIVKLYLRTMLGGKETYVFTAATYLDYDANEHLPFLMLGNKHILDDPLCKYAETYVNSSKGDYPRKLYEQIILSAEDNLKILEDCKDEILILPLRQINQMLSDNVLFEMGERFFSSLFNNISSFDDYFQKCKTIDDIMVYIRNDIDTLIMFNDTDDNSLPLKERFYNAINSSEYLAELNESDSVKFYMLVYGHIQLAVNIIVSCVEYHCIPYIRYTVALHYVILLSESFIDMEEVKEMRYKMSVAYVIYNLCDLNKLNSINLDLYIDMCKKNRYGDKLYFLLEQGGINKNNFTKHNITEIVRDELEKIYKALDDEKEEY